MVLFLFSLSDLERKLETRHDLLSLSQSGLGARKPYIQTTVHFNR